MKHYYFILLLLICSFVSCSKESAETPEDPNTTQNENAIEMEQELFTIVNNHRTTLGLNALEFNETAYKYANEHNDYMISSGAINHDHFSARASKISAKTNAEFIAENIAKDYNNANDVFIGWMNSTSHKITMEGDFSHTAVSIKINDTGTYYFTQIFFR